MKPIFTNTIIVSVCHVRIRDASSSHDPSQQRQSHHDPISLVFCNSEGDTVIRCPRYATVPKYGLRHSNEYREVGVIN